jgi:hypothetical protein
VAKTGAEVPRVYGGPAGWISVLIPAAIFAWFLQFLAPVAAGEQVLLGIDWVPSMDIRLSVLIDGLSLTFGLLISGIGALVTLYSTKYLGNHPEYPRFVLFLMLFMVGMLGLVLADNLIALFVFWEITTISSYLLIGFDSDSAKSRRSALQALLLTGTGGLALLAGHDPPGQRGGVLRAVGHPDHGRRDPGRSALHPDPDPVPRGRLHQIGAVPVPFLAAERDGRADAGLGLPAFGHHGEGGRLPDGADEPLARRDRAVVLGAGHRGRHHRRLSRACWPCARPTSSRCWPTRR